MNRVDGATKSRTESVKWIVAPQGGANKDGIARHSPGLPRLRREPVIRAAPPTRQAEE